MKNTWLLTLFLTILSSHRTSADVFLGADYKVSPVVMQQLVSAHGVAKIRTKFDSESAMFYFIEPGGFPSAIRYMLCPVSKPDQNGDGCTLKISEVKPQRKEGETVVSFEKPVTGLAVSSLSVKLEALKITTSQDLHFGNPFSDAQDGTSYNCTSSPEKTWSCTLHVSEKITSRP